MTVPALYDQVEAILAEGYGFWHRSIIPLPEPWERAGSVQALAPYSEAVFAVRLAVACQCFYYFRRLHGVVQAAPTWTTLLGDYFFSRFSQALIPLDSVPLTDAFSDYLKRAVQTGAPLTDYWAFVTKLPAVLL